MLNTWVVATMVAIVAGVVGFFVVLRGSSFVAHALPNGAFAGAAGASLLGINTIFGLGAFALLGALGIGWLGRRARHDVATALALVVMLGLGALFLSMSVEYAPEIYSLLFGEILGVSVNELLPTAVLGAICVGAIVVLYRPLMLVSVMAEVGEEPSDGDVLPRGGGAGHHHDRASGGGALDVQPDGGAGRDCPFDQQ